MKTLSKVTFLAVILFAALSVSAQNPFKFGHIDSQSLVAMLPETQQAQQDLEKEAKTVEDHLKTMEGEYQKKVQEYLENENLAPESPEKWTKLIKAEKEADIQALQQRIQDFQASAEKDLAQKRNNKYKPILEKVDNAIKEVAKEGKFTYIFDVNIVLYYSAEQSVDITPMVKKKLAIE